MTGPRPPTEAEIRQAFEAAARQDPRMARPPSTPSMAERATATLPYVGGAVGGLLGAPAGLLGVVGGATLGGGAGEAYRQLANRAFGLPTPTTPAAAAVDIGREGLGQGAMELGGGLLTQGIGRGARAIYRGYLKPSLARSRLRTVQMQVETALREKLPIGEAGRARLTQLKGRLTHDIDQLIRMAKGTDQVEKNAIVRRINDLAARYMKQDRPEADVEAIRRVARQLHENPAVPDIMTRAQAQDLKKAAYQMAEDAYGSSAAKEAQKRKAFGLRVGIERATAEPARSQLVAANLRLGRLLEVEPSVLRAIEREANKDVLLGWRSLASLGAGAGYGAAMHDPFLAATIALGARTALSPNLMSRAAIYASRLRRVPGAIPANVARVAVAAAMQPSESP